jgi:hypothetical protein
MTKKPKDPGVGPWAKEKLDALGQYLGFYTTVLKKQGQWLDGTIFVDAFAGPGLSRVRTKEKANEPPGLFGPDPESDKAETEFLKGSPRVALDVINPFSAYIFVDRDPERIRDLKALKARLNSSRGETSPSRKEMPTLRFGSGLQAELTGPTTAPWCFSTPSACRCRGQQSRPLPKPRPSK